MKGETLMTDVRAVIYVLKTDPDFAVFDRDVHGKEAERRARHGSAAFRHVG